MTKKIICIVFTCLFLLGAFLAEAFGVKIIVVACVIALGLTGLAALILEFKEDPRWPHKSIDDHSDYTY